MLNRLFQATAMSLFIGASLIAITNSATATEITTPAQYAYITDFDTGKVLFQKKADMQMKHASMAKIMTVFIAFERIREGGLSMDDKFQVSEKAWRLSTAGYSSMFIMVGDEVSVEDLLKGIIIASGNDACIALAEGIAGTEEQFAVLMTEKAIEIGMYNSNFSNSSGINDPDNYSTLKDILIMSNYLIKNFPDYYSYFAETEFYLISKQRALKYSNIAVKVKNDNKNSKINLIKIIYYIFECLNFRVKYF